MYMQKLATIVIRCAPHLLASLLLMFAGGILAAQTFTPFNPDASQFPFTKARFYALSADGRPMLNLTNSNFSIIENGVRREVVSIEFPPDPAIRAVSAVLAVDVSGSMSLENRMNFASDAATDWIKTISLETSECALTSFDDASYVNQDFTRIRAKLLAAVQALKPLNGTHYDNGFRQDLTGSLNVARRGQFKRIVVFLTDGLGGGTESDIIAQARRDSTTVYCITVGLKMPTILRNVADSTGGAWFENIQSRDDLIRIYRKILFESQNIQPATITWTTDVACVSARTAELKLRTDEGELSSTLKYETPPAALIRLTAQPRSITFRDIAVGNSQGQRVTLRATYQPVTITAIETNNPAFKIGALQLPITVSSGTATSFVVGFTPQDSTPQTGRIDIRTSTCAPVSLHARATYGNKRAAASQTMTITAPAGGEVLYSGADTVITWAGLMPSEAVALEYSIDAGSTWKLLNESVNGLRAAFRVPSVPSQKLVNGEKGRPMLVRARQVWQLPEGSDEPDITLDAHWGSMLSAKFSPDGTKILSASADRTLRLWDAYTGIALQTFEGHTNLVSDGVFSPDGAKILSVSHDNTARIWNTETAQILATGYGQGLNQFFFSQQKMTGAERLAFANTDGRKFLGGAFSPDGQEVMTTSDIGMATEWKAASMRPVGFVRQSGGFLHSVRYNQAGNKVLTGGGDFSARLWTVHGRSPEATFLGHTGQVLHAALSPDETRVVTASEDGTARVWSIKTGQSLFSMLHGGAVWSAEYSPDGKRIVTSSMDATVRLWDAKTGKRLATLRGGSAEKLGFQYAEFSPDGSRVVGAGLSTLGFIWEVGGGFLQEAQSKSFTVIAPQATVRDVNMGGVMVSVAKDSLVSIIANPDKSVVRVVDARITGANADEFSLVSGMPPFDVAAGGTDKPTIGKPIELRFNPRAHGTRTATLELITWTDTLRTTLRGEGITKSIETAPTLAFGQVQVKRRLDTTITLLRNTGTQSLTITRIQELGLNAEQFSTAFLLKRPPLNLAAGDSISIQASFQPNSAGVVSGGVRIDVAGLPKPLQVAFVGEGVATPLRATLGAELLSLNSDTASSLMPTQTSTANKILRIEEFETTIVRPVLNYVFFEENSADVAARYRRFESSDSTLLFSEEYADISAGSRLRSGLEGYYHILNVFGKRLRERINTTVRLIGCNSDDGAEKNNLALSRRRAEAVRDYLTQVWGIETRRISIQARNKPEKFSNPLDADGAAENRRVEIILEPQEAMSAIASNEAVFTAEPSIIRLTPSVTSALPIQSASNFALPEITEWSIDMLLGSHIISTFQGTGTLPETFDIRPTSAELRRIAAMVQSIPTGNHSLTFRLKASTDAASSVVAESAAIPYSLSTLRQKQTQDSTGTRFERFALTFFDFDKASLNKQNSQILEVAKRRIAPETDISILGYTDRMGDAAYNKRLSTDRAGAVAALIPSQSKQIRGFGESLLLYDNNLPEGRFYCRMVEILLKSRAKSVKP